MALAATRFERDFQVKGEIVEFDILQVARICGINVIKPVQGGLHYLAYCPFCGDDKHSHGHLYLRTDTNEWRCVMCEEGGFPIGLYARLRCNGDTKRAYKELLDAEYEIPEIRAPKRTAPVKVVEEPIADIERRNVVYNALLNLLPLQGNHQADLLKRGLTPEAIAENGYRSYPIEAKERWSLCDKLAKKYDLSHIPGFFKNKAGKWDLAPLPEGYFIPAKDAKGRIQGLQLRIYPFDKQKHQQKFLWLSSLSKQNGTRARQWIHVVLPELIPKSDMVVVTEGPGKANAAAHFLHVPILAIPGVSAGGYLIEVLKELGIKKVVTAFDIDYLVNEKVKKAIDRLTERLTEEGITLISTSWPTEWQEQEKNGKFEFKPTVKGIDDACLDRVNNSQEVSLDYFIQYGKDQITDENISSPEAVKSIPEEPKTENKAAAKQSESVASTLFGFAKSLFKL